MIQETLSAIKTATQELSTYALTLGTTPTKADPTGIIFDASVVIDDDYRKDKMIRTAQRLIDYIQKEG